MHKESRREMRRVLAKYADLSKNNVILDVGSYDVNGTYKVLVPENNLYIGVDMARGPNVSFVMPEFVIPLKESCIDYILCGQVLEHCRNPFKLVSEMTRVLKPGGRAFIVAPFICGEHRFPVDCFRYLPDGMNAIFEFTGLKRINSYLWETDCWGIGEK
jgi:SAM-dependent methyltransferase